LEQQPSTEHQPLVQLSWGTKAALDEAEHVLFGTTTAIRAATFFFFAIFTHFTISPMPVTPLVLL
jgi:hypothetical protein